MEFSFRDRGDITGAICETDEDEKLLKIFFAYVTRGVGPDKILKLPIDGRVFDVVEQICIKYFSCLQAPGEVLQRTLK